MRQILGLLVGLAVLVTTEVGVLAEQGEIGGIDKVYLRSGPSAEGAPLGVLSAGDRVTILGSSGAWTNVQTQDGKVGYVHHRYVSILAGAAAASSPARIETAPPPLSTPTAATLQPTPEPTSAAVENDALSTELAQLRAEVARLREQVRERKQQAGEGPTAAAVEPRAPATAAPPSARDQAVGVLAVAGLSLLVGWALGSVFSRRRSRSHRPRLRI